ncbi:MAG: single-stranded-DNA-specific exonuclease RecJ, partial [Anaerolineaceae bacterium]|nr:single-stranded-DNA-specific exonuclease RecJ [Anaerolineaceae bacterium]
GEIPYSMGNIKWIEPKQRQLDDEFIKAAGGVEFIAETLFQRGIISVEKAISFLDPDKYTPSDPKELPDLNLAADRIQNAIEKNELIGIWGDFDVDGQTATALLVKALKTLGAQVKYYVPVRPHESHGISLTGIERFLKDDVKLLVTCDTGINEHDALVYVSEQAIDTIITDHHIIPSELPKVFAIINPQRLATGHPAHSLSGVGVAYKLIEELFKRKNHIDKLEQFLDLVALGTVADLVPLVGETRYLVQKGIQTLKQTTNSGLLKLMEIARISQKNISEETISYSMAPRLNSIGRLSDANIAVELLSSENLDIISKITGEIERLNNDRKLTSDIVYQEARIIISKDPSLIQGSVIILSQSGWSSGVIGIVANQLVEDYNRPCVMIAMAEDGIGRASVRSIEGINIIDAISANKEFLIQHGGHKMAAGFSIEAENISSFRRAFQRTIETMMDETPHSEEIIIDAYLPLEDTEDINLIESIERMAPFGPGNPHLTFVSPQLKVIDSINFGKSERHRRMIVETQSLTKHNVIWWNGATKPLPDGIFDLAYRLRSSTYRGGGDIQVEWVSARAHSEISLTQNEKINPFEVQDFRKLKTVDETLQQLVQNKDILVWAEGNTNFGTNIKTYSRYDLRPCEELIILTLPPGRKELRDVLEKTSPKCINIFGINPSFSRLNDFLEILTSTIKHALISNDGWVNIENLAYLTAMTEIGVTTGIEFLIERTNLYRITSDGKNIQLNKRNSTINSEFSEDLGIKMSVIFRETAAYRKYYKRADKNAIFLGTVNFRK